MTLPEWYPKEERISLRLRNYLEIHQIICFELYQIIVHILYYVIALINGIRENYLLGSFFHFRAKQGCPKSERRALGRDVMLANWLSGSRRRLRGQEGPIWSRGVFKGSSESGGHLEGPRG